MSTARGGEVRLAITTRGAGRLSVLLMVFLFAGCGSTPKRDPELDRIEGKMSALESNPALGSLAPAELARARDAIEAMRVAPDKSRAHLGYLAERRIDVARATAEALRAERRLVELQREHDRILLEAARRDAELSRRESEELRLQSLTRAEDAERARFETAQALMLQESSASDAEAARARADQARRVAEAQSREANLARREAELALAAAESVRLQMKAGDTPTDATREVMTLAGNAFAPSRTTLQPAALAGLGSIVEFVNADPAASVRIEGHTDDAGSANLNQVLSQKRAEALRDALVERGVDAARITAIGRGEDAPIASNQTEEGRAANRRVEVIVVPPR